MAITKVMGIETEYGITVPGSPDSNPVLASSLLVNAFSGRGRKVRWDYEEESPLRDARGFEAAREPEAPTDDDLGLANVILTNGARYYVDHAHPEFSSPECLDPRTLVTYDKAGERILAESARRAVELAPGGRRIQIYKNNTDGKGTSYGTHENFLVDRTTAFARIVRDLTAFLVTRQVFAGAGSLVRDHHDGSVGFQIAQRSQFFEVEVGLETTLKRPIINTRDEPHADPERYRRLHVIIGDANMNEVATFLKTGALAVVLNMIEDNATPGEEWQLANPVQALRAIARDPTLKETVERKDGHHVTPCEIQWAYLDAAKSYLKDRETSHWQLEVLERWEAVLSQLEDDPRKASRTVDWVTKYTLMQQIADRDGLDWDDAKLALVDLQYHDVRMDKGLYYRLAAGGRVERLVAEQEIVKATTEPPEDTRAYFRGRCLAKYAPQIAAAGWDAIIFDIGRETLQRVPMLEPTRGTAAHTAAVLDGSPTAEDLIRNLQG
ncbi:MAG TPA: depupylase/deamidase Dop [Actinomycetes bacterium]|jgi:proteasome accessory factor A|nr:depupylase/deamidase Dop [Actinomycetes bacterium]